MRSPSRKICPIIKLWTKKEKIKRATLAKAERYKKDPAFAAREKERSRHYYREDPKKQSERRKVQRNKNKESYNEYSRNYYRANQTKLYGRIISARRIRNPIYGINQGILNLRGEITSVIDLSLKLGEKKDQNSTKAIIVLDSSPLIGFMVDSVESVLSLLAEEINAVPDNEINIHSDLFKGVAAKNEKFILLLDTEKIFGYDKFQYNNKEGLVA